MSTCTETSVHVAEKQHRSSGDYKTSLYNWITDSDGKTIIYNGATGCLAEVEPQYLDQIRPVVESMPGEAIDTSFISEPLHQQLVSGGFLVSIDIDEREFLRQVLLAPRYMTEICNISAVVTTRCNFACPYCVQDSSRGTDMKPEVVDRILELVRKTRSQSFSISFYGGEPLLVPDTVCEIMRELKKISSEKGINLYHLLVTNGYLLDADTTQELSRNGIDHLQVTLDGNKEYHDKRRVLKDGNGTFDRIIENIITASRCMDIDVRMNLESSMHTTCAEVAHVESALQGHQRIHLYAAPTRWSDSIDATKRNISSVCKCFPNRYYYKNRLEAGIPGCCAVSLSSRVVLPDGRFVLCWDEVGTDHPDYGSLLERNYPDPSRKSMWMRWDPYLNEPCASCRFLPTCRGSCPKDWIMTGKPLCEFHTEDDYVSFIITNYQKRVICRKEGL